MNRHYMRSIFVIMVLLLTAFVLCPAYAGAPLKINFQGSLEESGQPADGAKNFVFKIYDALTGGNLVWTSQTQSVVVADGVFSVVLETGTIVNLSTGVFTGPRYVEMTVNGVQLSPRQEIVSAPYALVAQALATDAIIPPASLDASSVTLLGNSFNSSGQLVKLDGAGKLPAVDGSALTGIVSGAVADNSISTAKLQDGAVTNAKVTLSTAAITSGKFGDSRVAITTNAISGLGALALAGSETDPVFTAHVSAGIVAGDITNWDTAYAWGDHSSVGYSRLAATQTFTGANIFSSTAAFTAQHASLPAVVVSSGLVVREGRVGISTSAPNSTLTVAGGLSLPIKTVTTDYTITGNDHTIIASAAGGPLTLTLPSAAGAYGRIYIVKAVNVTPVNTVTLSAQAGENIEGNASYGYNVTGFYANGDLVVCQSDGTNWYIIGEWWAW